MKKLLAIMLCICISLTCVGCGGGGSTDYGNKMVIRAVINQSGIGTAWMENAVARYEKLAENKQFGDKVGVVFELDAEVSPEKYLAPGDAHDIVTPNGDLFTYMQQGLLMNLNDLMTRPSNYDSRTIASRVNDDVKSYYQSLDGEYYALPHYQYYPGLTYNKALFDKNNYYFAADAQNGYEIPTTYGTALFINDANSTKSKGPDCKSGTADDGLPSTLEEFIILCKVLATNGIEPIQLSGEFVNYSNALASAFTAALAGADQMNAIWEMNGGEIEIVEETWGNDIDQGVLSYSDENLFTGISYIKKPNVTKTTIDLTNGFKMKDISAKYYAAAMMEIIEREGFYSADSYIDTVSHTGAQERFMLGDLAGRANKAMLIEGSYWYNEALYQGKGDIYNMTGNDVSKLDIRFMPLPTYVTNAQRDADAATERKNTISTAAIASVVVQSHVAKDAAKTEAVLDFLDFLYSTEERINFTLETGLLSGMDYDFDPELLSSKGIYSVELLKLVSNSNVVMQSSSNAFMKANRANVIMDIFAGDTWWKNSKADSYCKALREGVSLIDLQEDRRISPSQWESWKENFVE